MSRDQIIDDSTCSVARRGHPAQQPKQRLDHFLYSSAGFTLIELLTVVAIVGVLVVLAIPSYDEFVTRAKNSRAKQEIRLLETEIHSYMLETGFLPASLATINRDTLLDPWGNTYVFYIIVPPSEDDPLARSRFGIPLNHDFDLYSKGKDGLTQPVVAAGTGRDDLVRAANGTFLGLGEDW